MDNDPSQRDPVTSESTGLFAVQAAVSRAKPDVGGAALVRPEEMLSSLATTASSLGDEDQNPLSRGPFLLGLKCVGYLEPLDASRNKVKQRFNHFLEKQHFKANLYAFLEHAGVERLGECMVRFAGTPEEPHSPYVSIFVTSPIGKSEAVKIYAASDPESTASRASTLWSPLSAPSDDGDSASLPSRPRGERRDTFQRVIDLDAEIEKSEREEQLEKEKLKLNTRRNSTRPADSPAIQIDTKNTAPIEPPMEENRQRTPVTPTVLESVKLLGQSVIASLPPSMQQLPATVQTRFKEWLDHRPAEDHEIEYDSEEDRRERERRRRRRERRKRAAEARDAQDVADSREESSRDRPHDSRQERRRRPRTEEEDRYRS
ncbi:uncharacterized protein JCM15063_001480 [Sporobolomyces koalae]|uniref:uncharacterized protein n=1 Tax=Sporobolomyces koalae TaxID=500713 RepID=UPI00317A5AC0